MAVQNKDRKIIEEYRNGMEIDDMVIGTDDEQIEAQLTPNDDDQVLNDTEIQNMMRTLDGADGDDLIDKFVEDDFNAQIVDNRMTIEGIHNDKNEQLKAMIPGQGPKKGQQSIADLVLDLDDVITIK